MHYKLPKIVWFPYNTFSLEPFTYYKQSFNLQNHHKRISKLGDWFIWENMFYCKSFLFNWMYINFTLNRCKIPIFFSYFCNNINEKCWKYNFIFYDIDRITSIIPLWQFLSTGNNGSKLWDKVHKNCKFKFYDQLKGSLGGHCIKANFIHNIYTNFRKLRKKLKNFFIHGWVTLEIYLQNARMIIQYASCWTALLKEYHEWSMCINATSYLSKQKLWN